MYSTFIRASRAATRHAIKSGQDVHIFQEDGMYSIGDDYDADTFFFGQDPVATVDPEGNLHQ